MKNNNAFVFMKVDGGDGAEKKGFPDFSKMNNPFAQILQKEEKKEKNSSPKNPQKKEEEKKEPINPPKNPKSNEEEKKEKIDRKNPKKDEENMDYSILKINKRPRTVFCPDCKKNFTTKKNHVVNKHPEQLPTPERMKAFTNDYDELLKIKVHMNQIIQSWDEEKIKQMSNEYQQFNCAYEYYKKIV